jgi:hypothetical protein
MSRGWSTHMVATFDPTKRTAWRTVRRAAPKVWRPLTRKLKTIPAEVDTTFASTIPHGALSIQNSARSMSVLQTPTARKRTTVRDLMRTAPGGRRRSCRSR